MTTTPLLPVQSRQYFETPAEHTIEEGPEPYSVYQAGPMSNIPQFNFPEFFEVADILRGRGWIVKSPADHDLESIPWEEMNQVPGFNTGDLALYTANCPFDMGVAMEWDLVAIRDSDGIVMHPGWERSTGARWERCAAEAMNREVWLAERAFEGKTGWGWVFNLDPVQKRVTNFLAHFDDIIITEATSRFAELLDIEALLTKASPRELLNGLSDKLGHVPGMRAHIERIGAQLA